MMRAALRLLAVSTVQCVLSCQSTEGLHWLLHSVLSTSVWFIMQELKILAGSLIEAKPGLQYKPGSREGV